MFALSGYICFHSLLWTAVNCFLCNHIKEYQSDSYRQNKHWHRPYIISGQILSLFLINKPSTPPCSFFFFNITEICLKYYLFLDVLLSFPRHFITCIFPGQRFINNYTYLPLSNTQKQCPCPGAWDSLLPAPLANMRSSIYAGFREGPLTLVNIAEVNA